MSNKTSIFYKNRQSILKEINNQIKNIVLILKKKKDKIEIRQARKSLKNYSENYENK
jgi:hypothetical protein